MKMNNNKKLQKFLLKAKQIHGTKYDYSKVDYVSSKQHVTIICPVHNEFQQSPTSHLKKHGCKQCFYDSNKLTLTSFIGKARIKHGLKYDYSKVNYVNNHTKVIIICPVHGEFLQITNEHLRGSECPKCVNEIRKDTLQNFIEKAEKIHGIKYNYSKVDYVNSILKVIIICPVHGEFLQTPAGHLQKKGCKQCSNKNTIKLTIEQFVQKANLKHGLKYDYSKVNYVNTSTKVTIICSEHGEFTQLPKTHLKGYGCKKCKDAVKKKPLENFIEKANIIHNNKYIYVDSVYVNSRTKLKIICVKHGSFKQTPNNHLNGYGCKFCAKE